MVEGEWLWCHSPFFVRAIGFGIMVLVKTIRGVELIRLVKAIQFAELLGFTKTIEFVEPIRLFRAIGYFQAPECFCVLWVCQQYDIEISWIVKICFWTKENHTKKMHEIFLIFWGKSSCGCADYNVQKNWNTLLHKFCNHRNSDYNFLKKQRKTPLLWQNLPKKCSKKIVIIFLKSIDKSPLCDEPPCDARQVLPWWSTKKHPA